MDRLTITRPDDWHLHLRDGAVLNDTVPHTARVFGRAIIMPNLMPPVTDTQQALRYRERILQALPEGSSFQPLMVLYLTDNTRPEDIIAAQQCGLIYGCKLYPAGATTHSDSGVTDIANIYPALEMMAECGIPLLVHGEMTAAEIDIFDREARFIDHVLQPLIVRMPKLKVVFEHITTADAADFVRHAGENVAATITVQHLLLNRNDMLVGGIKPHHYCLPVLKRERHRIALVEAATSGSGKFFLGTDSAPHSKENKENSCGCAGIFTAPAAIEWYAEIFEQADALNQLEGFASHYGADFYGLPRNSDTITLQKNSWQMAQVLPLTGSTIVPFRAGKTVNWQVV
ncbi:MAG: dihydroorotase [Gammaproteobacteria bacterium]|nr:dihydroorotase [Gammaproteobacteria bacterium]